MKFFSGLSLVLALVFILNGVVSAEERTFDEIQKEKQQELSIEQSKIPSVIQNLQDEDSEELEQKVLEDIKNNPDKVQYAEPVDPNEISTKVSLPYSYSFNFKNSLLGAYFTPFSYSTVYNQINNTSGYTVTFSLYKSGGTFVGSRVYFPNQIGKASFTGLTRGQSYYFILTGSGTGYKTGTGGLWEGL
ncbi:hypothetical protein [uncultured Metabacillus sp.]|uniref:hypothetical protein n=1 Tax=uncultured Metabacillus sp. TaxID=2860135 RepID=UPI0026317403|nr:hypothetical protein [uncultured Metabacillus sp.]